MQKLEWRAPSGGRLLKLLEEAGVPYNAGRKALRSKDIRVNGVKVKEDCQLQAGDELCVFLPEPPRPRVIFEDERLLALEKPQGLETTGEQSLESQARLHWPAARPCHRLDAQTGGLVLFALDDKTEEALLEAIRLRLPRKIYQCIVCGIPQPAEKLLRGYLVKNARDAQVRVYDSPHPQGREILTRYRLLEQLEGGLSRLEVELITGRTHQIRAHLAHAGHPVLGDDKYGDREMNRRLGVRAQQLFAVQIALHFPQGSLLARYEGLELNCPPRWSSKVALQPDR
jgi:23S rRNA pseudouridine955/2504/2580 synthase